MAEYPDIDDSILQLQGIFDRASMRNGFGAGLRVGCIRLPRTQVREAVDAPRACKWYRRVAVR
jgi:hypothetical protein